jgi:SAM-dependent methyltransferase
METLRASIKYAPYYIGLIGFIYRDRLFDWKYGVETRSRVSLNDLDISYDSKRFGRNYGPSDPVIFKNMLSCLKIKHEDFTFVDFGSGKGRAILMASEFPFKRIVGIEFSATLNEMARKNIRHYKSRTQKCRDLEVIESDATTYEIPNERAIFYFNNPFNEPIMARVLANIQRSLEEHPRDIFVAYSYGTPEMYKFVESSSFLRKVASTYQYFIYQNRA